jgi:hypothetical protein
MNKDKIKILLRLYKEDLITADEFLILFKEEPIYISHTIPNLIPTQPFNTPYYTIGSNSTNSAAPNSFTHQQSTVGGAFSKKWNNPEEPKFDS